MAFGRSAAVDPGPHTVAGLVWPVELRPHRSARRWRLRLDAARERLVLTIPPRTRAADALAWARAQHDWVDAQVAKVETPTLLAPGAVIPIEGAPFTLEWREGAPRRVSREADRLVAGGPRDGFERRIGRWLKAEALRVLTQDTSALAERESIAIASVAVGDATSRWGSCSADGRIRYNWRLFLAPPEVRRFVVAHEVAHRRHMDHGTAFHALETKLYGGPVAPARAALRRLSPGLRRIRLG